jgi:hypothetical protein
MNEKQPQNKAQTATKGHERLLNKEKQQKPLRLQESSKSRC